MDNQILEILKVIQRDISEVKGDVSSLKDDVSLLKGNVSSLKDDVSLLKDDMSSLKDDVSLLKDDVSLLKETQRKIEDKIDVIGQHTADLIDFRGDVERNINKIQKDLSGFKNELDETVEEVLSVDFLAAKNYYDIVKLKIAR